MDVGEDAQVSRSGGRVRGFVFNDDAHASRGFDAIVTVPAARVAVAMEGAPLVEVRSFPAKYAQDVDVTPRMAICPACDPTKNSRSSWSTATAAISADACECDHLSPSSAGRSCSV